MRFIIVFLSTKSPIFDTKDKLCVILETFPDKIQKLLTWSVLLLKKEAKTLSLFLCCKRDLLK